MAETSLGAEDLRTAFNIVLADLLEQVGASRTTLRIDLPQFSFQVDDPAGEARMAGVRPLSGETALDQRGLNTVRWMAEHHDYLVQPSCRDADPAPPQALIEIYGVQAQMLGPIVREKELMGWVSVHENRSTRQWSEMEVSHLRQAVEKIHALLDGAGI
ncbi:GAF domain-containing protein [Telmatospirillum sp. J64-1]|uniref:GAF domain-containing protein n=1 Tax=Telmatospirillum sp. J64-1 TaxID=2502183 RepID=UPI00115E1C1A|nr:GAF domain-containing protein [Telmatospirillum sp. J64-1]